MERINTTNKAVDLFGVGKHGFRDGDPIAGVGPTYMSAAFMNAIQEELANVVEGYLGALNPADRTQLKQAIDAAIAAAVAGAGVGGKVAKAGDTMTGTLNIVAALLQAFLRHTDNTAALKDHIRLYRGSGAGTRAALQTLGDASNGLSEVDLTFLSAADATVKAFKFKNSGRLELGADPTLALEAATKQYVDAATIPDATTAVKGKVQLATASDVDTGTDATKAVTPAAFAGSKRSCRAWGTYVGSTGAVGSSFNVSSMTLSSFTQTVNFTNAMPDANYAAPPQSSGTSIGLVVVHGTRSTTSMQIQSFNTTNNAGQNAGATLNGFAVFG